jgi:hypothetical protein
MESVLSGREVPESSKLQGIQNYALWSFKLKTTLQGERVWREVDPHIESGTSVPSTRASSSATSTTTDSIDLPVVSSGTTPATLVSSVTALNSEDLKFRAL